MAKRRKYIYKEEALMHMINRTSVCHFFTYIIAQFKYNEELPTYF